MTQRLASQVLHLQARRVGHQRTQSLPKCRAVIVAKPGPQALMQHLPAKDAYLRREARGIVIEQKVAPRLVVNAGSARVSCDLVEPPDVARREQMVDRISIGNLRNRPELAGECRKPCRKSGHSFTVQ
jgi:hypothetical protein